MRILSIAVAGLLPCLPVRADSYTGVVVEVKHFHDGGVAVDLGGKWPNQTMTFYVLPANAAAVGPMPSEAAKVTASEVIEQYRGKPEIKIHKADQWEW
jgi:hypothetical protein